MSYFSCFLCVFLCSSCLFYCYVFLLVVSWYSAYHYYSLVVFLDLVLNMVCFLLCSYVLVRFLFCVVISFLLLLWCHVLLSFMVFSFYLFFVFPFSSFLICFCVPFVCGSFLLFYFVGLLGFCVWSFVFVSPWLHRQR